MNGSSPRSRLLWCCRAGSGAEVARSGAEVAFVTLGLIVMSMPSLLGLPGGSSGVSACLRDPDVRTSEI